MQKLSFAEAIETIRTEDSRYAEDAYYFLREALDFSLKLFKKPSHGAVKDRHVTGQELVQGIGQFALQQYGPLAKTVLEYWGITRCEDFGEIVFNMIHAGLLGKTEKDRKEDFGGGYNFDDMFVKPFLPSKKVAARTPRPPARKEKPRETV
ncbi:MAG: Minf_1886 family protein [Verrucomicrobiia bacterium]